MTELVLEGMTQADQIREVGRAYGNNKPAREVAERCIYERVFDADQLRGFQMSGAIKKVEKALKEKGDNGRPFMLPIEDGSAPRWKQYELFDYDDFDFVISLRVKQASGNLDEARAMQEDCKARFGSAPYVPELGVE